MENSFYVKKIVLPSGKSVEVVYFGNPDEPGAAPNSKLDICPECHGDLVYPVWWQEQDRNMWKIELRCPSCEWSKQGVYSHAEVEVFDVALNRRTDGLISDLDRLSRENMEADIERFVSALDADHILPEDFG